MPLAPDPWIPRFYGQESEQVQAYHKAGLTTIEDIVPWVRLMVSEEGGMTGQTILVNGGYTTK